MTEIADLDAAVVAFSSAETALREMAGHAEQVTTAKQELTEARADLDRVRERLRQDFESELNASELKSAERVEKDVSELRSAAKSVTSSAAAARKRSDAQMEVFEHATEVLDAASRDLASAERTLADARGGIREMILVHGDIARELKLASTALAALKPEGLAQGLDEIHEAVRSSQASVLDGLETRVATQTELLIARHEALIESVEQSKEQQMQQLTTSHDALVEQLRGGVDQLRRRGTAIMLLLLVVLFAVAGFGIALLLR